jgi:flavin-dependent dehydrogenase
MLGSLRTSYDAVIIGGGPAGSTVGYILAKAGLSVLLLEKDKFPRFHIGESLLPATNHVWERIGVRKKLDEVFVHKPGGRWYTNELQRLESNFAKAERQASFMPQYPYAYMVERAKFDAILLDNAAKAGVEVREKTRVDNLVFEGKRLTGLKLSNSSIRSDEVRAKMFFDCSGNAALIANKLGIRHPNHQKRMAVYAHYEAEALEEGLKDGWFVGAMIDDGWVWTIPLSNSNISVGVVTSLKNFKDAKHAPERYLESLIDELPFFKLAIKGNRKRISPISIHGNLGYSSDRFAGDGWVLVGDAAFFIDPCYSTGVHLAMTSGQDAADIFLKHYGSGMVGPEHFADYERLLRRHESVVHRLVDTFYMATNNATIRRWMPAVQNRQPFYSQFATATGGDLSRNHFVIEGSYRIAKSIGNLFRDPTSSPRYNERIFAEGGVPAFFCEEQ